MRQFGELEAVIMNRFWACGRPGPARVNREPMYAGSRCDAGHEAPLNPTLIY